MKRKSDGTPARNDSVKPGCGIDGDKGEDFTRQRRNSSDPWTVKADHDEQPSYTGRYTDNNSGLRQKLPAEVRAGNNQAGVGRDILDDVEGQSSDSGNRAVKSRG